MTKITKVTWVLEAWEDYEFWQKNDKTKTKRINTLIKSAIREPYSGIGKPEKLKFRANVWSRRIDIEHRLVYEISGDILYIVQCRYHYGK